MASVDHLAVRVRMPGRGLGTLTALEVLVIGGHGKVGLRLLRLLALDGHRSRGVTRKSVVTSLRHLVDTVTGLADRGVGVRSLHEQVDTTTPGGKLVVPVVAALAEFEHDLIRERTAAGLAAARARGRHGGRPSVLSGHKLQVARELYRSGEYSVAAIATTLGVSRASIYRHLDIDPLTCGEQVRGGRDGCLLA